MSEMMTETMTETMTDVYEIGGRTLGSRIAGIRAEKLEHIGRLRAEAAAQESDLEANVAAAAEHYRRGYEAHARLTAAGFEPDAFPTNMDVYVEAKQLPAICRAVGRVRVAYRQLLDADAMTVKVTVKPVAYPEVSIHYTRVLAPGGGRCKIVREARIEARLVCDL